MPRRFQNKYLSAPARVAISALFGVWLIGCAPTLHSQTFADDFQRGLAAYDRGDYTAARAFWQPLADNYDLAALRNIGHMYRLGQGVAQNQEKAAHYYARAAELGFAPAQFNLAVMLHAGAGMDADKKAARQWAQRAANAGYAPAIAWLAALD
jgi:TPR repeat protein|tara:strand:- start:336 stop:794 length:459 start_codon:yes stop_codon:yes gene_type:complete